MKHENLHNYMRNYSFELTEQRLNGQFNNTKDSKQKGMKHNPNRLVVLSTGVGRVG